MGGDPERDDSGLPPVDVVIPDDARELDRDVQAYQRELRALRRRQRASRLRGPLTRDGMVLPLLAGCLILALITSTLLIMFAADQTGVPQLPGRAAAGHSANSHPRSGRSQPATMPTITPGSGLVPTAILLIRGSKEPLRTITATGPTVLALIPVACQCAPALRRLGAEASDAHVRVYLVGTGQAMNQVPGLAAEAGQLPTHVSEDPGNVLGITYKPAGLTAILVRQGGAVASVARDLPRSAQLDLASGLRLLAPAGQRG